MPLSEFLRMARGKLESSQQKNDVVSGSDDDLVELVWENGQIVMQGHSSKITRSPTRNSNTSRATNSRFGKFEGVESILNDMAPVVPSGELDLSHDDEMVPWLSYPMDDSLGQDYVSTLISDVTGNGMSNQSSLLSGDKRSSCNNPGSNALRYGAQDVVSNNTCNNPATMKMDRQQQNIRPPSNFLNFSHFSRPSNLVKGKSDASGSSGAGKMETSPEKSRFNSTPKDAVVVVNTPKGGSPPERKESLCLETSSIKNDNSRKGVPDGERIVEPIVASSSVGSGNSGDRVSCEQTHNSKRKFRDIDESDCRSDDVDTESLDAKKPNHVRGSKRGRAAEVHNLSERRRRDRINEKMRALQELIPNCNKADKASMLDEAIEYLKTLQLQVQMMSMGAGLCMPPMMFPTGMQHIHPAHFPQMGFGMGMMDMNGVSSGYPMFPVPHYPPPPVSGVPNFQRIPVFGHPGQNSVPGGPFGPVTSAMGMGMNASNTSSIENPGDPLPPMHSHSKGNAEASCSINHKSNQATTEVLDQSASIQDNKNATGHTTLTSATKSEISKEPGDHNKSPLG